MIFTSCALAILFCAAVGRVAHAKGGGKGGSTPSIQETPKAQTTKPVTEAATAARDSQRDRAARAAGLRASILTSPLDSATTQKTLLGQ